MQRYALALVVASLFALPVQGAATLVSSTGGIETFGQMGTFPILPGPDTLAFGHNVPRTDSGLFQQNLYDACSDPRYGTISAMTSQLSSFTRTSGNQLTGASFAGTAAITAATFSPYGSYTKAVSNFSFVFQVADAPVDYSVAIRFSPIGTLSGSVFQLWDVNAGSLVTSVYSETETIEGHGWGGTLQPGLYRLDSWTDCDMLSPSWPNIAYANSMTYNLTLTPEPASLALLALGGLAVVRRRR